VLDTTTSKAVKKFEFAHGDGTSFMPVPVGARGRSGWAYAASVSADGMLIAYGSQSNYLAVHEIATGKVVRFVDKQPDGAGKLAFSPDRRILAWSGSRRPAIHLLELATGKERLVLDGHKGRVTSLVFSADGRTLVSGSEDTTALVWDLTGKLSAKGGEVDLDKAWRDLASGDAAAAHQSILRLASTPKDAVAFLRQRVLPVAAADEKRLAKLIADLDNTQFDLRDAAQGELENLGESALPAIRAALEGKPSVELRRRLEGLAEKQARELWNPGPERLRVLRAVEALEVAATPEAQALLKTLAQGKPGAQLTEDARAALSRLSSRPAAQP
jgi:hypothetical protein